MALVNGLLGRTTVTFLPPDCSHPIARAAAALGRGVGLLAALVMLVSGLGASLLHAPVLWFLGLCLVASLASIVVHELGHVIAFRALGAGHALVVVQGTRMRVIRSTLDDPRDRMVTLAGPCSPAAVALLVWALTGVSLGSACAVVIATAHLLGLLDGQADGRAVRRRPG